MADSPVVNVSIFGTEYKISSPAGPDRTREVARAVDRKMREVAHSLSLRSMKKIAVLTAVNLADELHREQASGQHLEQSAASTAQRLAARVDEGRWPADPAT